MDQKFIAKVVGTSLKESGYGENRREWKASQIAFNAGDSTRDVMWIVGEFPIGTEFTITVSPISQ